MSRVHTVQGIEDMPFYVVSSTDPWTISEDDFIHGVPLLELIAGLKEGEGIYLVDYTSVPGTTRVTRLV